MTSDAVVWSAPVEVQLTDATERLAALFDTHHKPLCTGWRGGCRRTRKTPAIWFRTPICAPRSRSARVPSGAAREEAWLVRVLINVCRDGWRRTASAIATIAALPPTPRLRGWSRSGARAGRHGPRCGGRSTLTPRRCGRHPLRARRHRHWRHRRAAPGVCRRSRCDGIWRAGDGELAQAVRTEEGLKGAGA